MRVRGDKMKCHKCKYENIVKASYCQKCGEKFTDKEKEIAYNKTIYGKIDKLKEIKDIVTLNIITGNIVFKIASLLIVLGIGLYFLLTVGINTKILKSNDYQIFYNKEIKEYYLLVDDNYDKVNVAMYLPNRIKDLTIYHYNLDDTLLEQENVKKEDKISLDTYKEDYYIIESKYRKKTDQMKIFVYHKSDI